MPFDPNLLDDEDLAQFEQLREPASAPAPSSLSDEVQKYILSQRGLDQDLTKARADRDSSNNIVNLGQAFTQLGAGIAGTKADPAVFDAMRKQSQTTADEALSDSDRRRKMVSDYISNKRADGQLKLSEDRLNRQETRDEESRRRWDSQFGRHGEERGENQKIKFITAVNGDSVMKKLNERLTAADSARELLDINNPISGEAAKTAIARLSGEVGNLAEGDIKRFGGSQALASRMEQMKEQAFSGKLTDENRKYLNEIVDAYERSLGSAKAKRAKELSKQMSGALHAPENELFDSVMPGYKEPTGKVQEIERKTKDGRTAIFDSNTKKFLRYKE